MECLDLEMGSNGGALIAGLHRLIDMSHVDESRRVRMPWEVLAALVSAEEETVHVQRQREARLRWVYGVCQ